MRRIEELPIPQQPGAEGWDDFAAAADVHNAVEADAYGNRELSVTAEEALPEDTLVLREHGGHRLGLLLKA